MRSLLVITLASMLFLAPDIASAERVVTFNGIGTRTAYGFSPGFGARGHYYGSPYLGSGPSYYYAPAPRSPFWAAPAPCAAGPRMDRGFDDRRFESRFGSRYVDPRFDSASRFGNRYDRYDHPQWQDRTGRWDGRAVSPGRWSDRPDVRWRTPTPARRGSAVRR